MSRTLITILALFISGASVAATVDAANAREVAERCDKMWQAFAASGDERGMRTIGENPECLKAHEILAAQKAAGKQRPPSESEAVAVPAK